jgi:hypothetical protein
MSKASALELSNYLANAGMGISDIALNDALARWPDLNQTEIDWAVDTAWNGLDLPYEWICLAERKYVDS